jgi:hypothetical protein
VIRIRVKTDLEHCCRFFLEDLRTLFIMNELGLQEDERLAMLEEEARQARLSKKNGLSQETPSSFLLNSGLSFYVPEAYIMYFIRRC